MDISFLPEPLKKGERQVEMVFNDLDCYISLSNFILTRICIWVMVCLQLVIKGRAGYLYEKIEIL